MWIKTERRKNSSIVEYLVNIRYPLHTSSTQHMLGKGSPTSLSIVARVFADVLSGAPFHVCHLNLSAKAVCLQKKMVVASATNAPSRVKHADRSNDEPTEI